MTDIILNLITWVDAAASALCAHLGVNPMAVVTVVVIAGLLAHFATV